MSRWHDDDLPGIHQFTIDQQLPDGSYLAIPNASGNAPILVSKMDGDSVFPPGSVQTGTFINGDPNLGTLFDHPSPGGGGNVIGQWTNPAADFQNNWYSPVDSTTTGYTSADYFQGGFSSLPPGWNQSTNLAFDCYSTNGFDGWGYKAIANPGYNNFQPAGSLASFAVAGIYQLGLNGDVEAGITTTQITTNPDGTQTETTVTQEGKSYTFPAYRQQPVRGTPNGTIPPVLKIYPMTTILNDPNVLPQWLTDILDGADGILTVMVCETGLAALIGQASDCTDFVWVQPLMQLVPSDYGIPTVFNISNIYTTVQYPLISGVPTLTISDSGVASFGGVVHIHYYQDFGTTDAAHRHMLLITQFNVSADLNFLVAFELQPNPTNKDGTPDIPFDPDSGLIDFSATGMPAWTWAWEQGQTTGLGFGLNIVGSALLQVTPCAPQTITGVIPLTIFEVFADAYASLPGTTGVYYCSAAHTTLTIAGVNCKDGTLAYQFVVATNTATESIVIGPDSTPLTIMSPGTYNQTTGNNDYTLLDASGGWQSGGSGYAVIPSSGQPPSLTNLIDFTFSGSIGSGDLTVIDMVVTLNDQSVRERRLYCINGLGAVQWMKRGTDIATDMGSTTFQPGTHPNYYTNFSSSQYALDPINNGYVAMDDNNLYMTMYYCGLGGGAQNYNITQSDGSTVSSQFTPAGYTKPAGMLVYNLTAGSPTVVSSIYQGSIFGLDPSLGVNDMAYYQVSCVGNDAVYIQSNDPSLPLLGPPDVTGVILPQNYTGPALPVLGAANQVYGYSFAILKLSLDSLNLGNDASGNPQIVLPWSVIGFHKQILPFNGKCQLFGSQLYYLQDQISSLARTPAPDFAASSLFKIDGLHIDASLGLTLGLGASPPTGLNISPTGTGNPT